MEEAKAQPAKEGQQKEPEHKDEILKWLQALQEKNFFKIILAVETGSRGRGLETSGSDFDVKGFYVSQEGDNQVKTSQLVSKQDKITINKQKFPIDYTFLDFRMFLKGHSFEASRLFLFSEVKYIDLIPQSLKEDLRLSLPPPIVHFRGCIFSLVDRQISKKQNVLVKRVLNLCNNICELLYFQVNGSFKDYAYNYWVLSERLYK